MRTQLSAPFQGIGCISKLHLGLLALALTATGSLYADNYAFMIAQSGEFGTIDLDTGVFTQRGNSGITPAGMGVSRGQLYIANFGGSGLYRVSHVNGSVTLIGNSTITYYSLGSTSTGLYAIGVDNNLYSINPTTAAATLVGPTNVAFDGQFIGMSSNSNALYATAGGNLYTLCTCSGAAGLVGNTGTNEIGAMVSEGGSLYAGTNSPIAVYTVDASTGALTFVANESGGRPSPANFWGLAPSVLLNIGPSSLSFAAQAVGTTSAPQNIALTNNGFTAMTISQIQASGDFSQTNTCGSSLSAGGSCSISVSFSPTATGERTGTLTITDDAGGSPQTVKLSGTGA